MSFIKILLITGISMQNAIRLFFIIFIGLQSMLCHAAMQASYQSEEFIVHRYVSKLLFLAEAQFALNLKNMIDKDVQETDHLFEKYHSMIDGVHRIEVAHAINKDIYTLDGELLVRRGQLLIDAAMKNNIHMVSLLLNAGVNVNTQDDEGCTVLHHAVEKNMIELTALLLQQPAIDVTIKKQWGDAPLHIAARKDLSGKLVAMLLQAGAHYNSKSSGSTPVACAIHYKNIEATRLLIAAGANVNISKFSLLNYCTKYPGYHDNKLEVAELLLKAGIIVDQVEKTDGRYIDMTPLKYAVVGNDHEMVALLARYGADVNAVIKYKDQEHLNQNLLFYAINHSYIEIVKTLLKFGVVVDTIKSKKKCKTGCYSDMTELQLAVCVQDLESVSLLIAYGANPHALLKLEIYDNILEISTLFLAIQVGNARTVDVLYRAGVDLDGIKISDKVISISGNRLYRNDNNKEMMSILTSGGAQILASNPEPKLH